MMTKKQPDAMHSIHIKEHCLDQAGVFAREITGEKAFVVTDSNVYPLYFDRVRDALSRAGILVSHVVIPAGEASKSLKNLGNLYEECVKHHITRTDMIIALGGGVVGDLTGFLAATYLRGVPLMQIPTTFLAQIDSSIGGKTAIDLPCGKNLAGAFYQPKAVLMDPSVLATLSEEIFADGMAEAIKYACIRDRGLFSLLQSPRDNLVEIITRCVRIKCDVVQRDAFDTGERMILNFGHTVGHAIETMGHYTEFTHGQAVAAGMVCVLEIGMACGRISQEDVAAVTELIRRSHLPVRVPYAGEACLRTVITDKKMTGSLLQVVLPKGLGDCSVQKMTPSEFMKLAKQTSVFQP